MGGKVMKAITFECETITPMFLGGADGRTPELRPPSIKGLMRFWWRAMNGHLSLEELKEREAKIFGTSDEKIGRSKFSIRVKPHKLNSSKDKLPPHPVVVRTSRNSFKINILEYLAYGTHEYKSGQGNIFIRDYIRPKQKFSVFITIPEHLKDEIIKILKRLSTFGGLGSRSRNGFGSFKILSINGNSNSFYVRVGKEKDSSSYELPKYSAFSKDMRLWKSKQSYDSWDKALAELGKAYKYARERIESKHNYEKRQYIGAPIIVNANQMSKLDRHSKPYFMSVHYESDKYIGYILYLPSKYAYGKEGLNDSEETKHFEEACNSLNQHLSDKLEEVPL